MANMKEEMIDDMFDDISDEETDDVLAQVSDELGLEIGAQVRKVHSHCSFRSYDWSLACFGTDKTFADGATSSTFGG